MARGRVDRDGHVYRRSYPVLITLLSRIGGQSPRVISKASVGVINIQNRRANSVRTNKPNRISSEYLNNLMGREGLACVARRDAALMALLRCW